MTIQNFNQALEHVEMYKRMITCIHGVRDLGQLPLELRESAAYSRFTAAIGELRTDPDAVDNSYDTYINNIQDQALAFINPSYVGSIALEVLASNEPGYDTEHWLNPFVLVFPTYLGDAGLDRILSLETLVLIRFAFGSMLSQMLPERTASLEKLNTELEQYHKHINSNRQYRDALTREAISRGDYNLNDKCLNMCDIVDGLPKPRLVFTVRALLITQPELVFRMFYSI